MKVKPVQHFFQIIFRNYRTIVISVKISIFLVFNLYNSYFLNKRFSFEKTYPTPMEYQFHVGINRFNRTIGTFSAKQKNFYIL